MSRTPTFFVEISMDDAALSENPGGELNTILKDIARKALDIDTPARFDMKVFDSNGNAVGTFGIKAVRS